MDQNDIIHIKDKVERLFNDAIKGIVKGKPISIGVLTSNGRRFLEELSSLEFKEKVDFVLNPSDLAHIHKEHFGENEKDCGNNIPLSINDIRNMVDVILSPDYVVYLGEKNKGKKFAFLSASDKGAYNLIEVYGDRRGNLTAKTFYQTKKGVTQRAIILIKSLHSTSETDGATLSPAKVPQLFDLPTDSG